MDICHFYKVDLNNVVVDFTSDGAHRTSLTIPFMDRGGSNVLCVIGQNPSNANNRVADKTLHYLERFVFEKMPEYSKIIMLNLYSRVDTKKKYSTDIERDICECKVKEIINSNSDFLIVYGKLKNQGAYKFTQKAKALKTLLKNKKVSKINIESEYAPHPGNSNIYYGNYCYGIADYDFSDIA